MDIKEIALKVAEESGAVCYSPAPFLRAVRGYGLTYEQLQNFAEALISAYKAELLNEVGEQVACRYKDHNGHWCFMGKQYGNNEPLYTSDQLAAAILKATKPLEDQLAKAEQLWQVAQGRCDGLEEKLAKAERRVAEACAAYVLDNLDGFEDGDCIAEAIRSGEWRKFVKEG